MKCQILFSRKNKKNITNSSFAESAHSVVSVKLPLGVIGRLFSVFQALPGNLLYYFVDIKLSHSEPSLERQHLFLKILPLK